MTEYKGVVKHWDVLASGFDEVFQCKAETPQKAKAAAYRAFIDAGYRQRFMDFVSSAKAVRRRTNMINSPQDRES